MASPPGLALRCLQQLSSYRMSIDCGGWIDDGPTQFVLVPSEMPAGGLYLSFFGMSARRAKSHGWFAVTPLLQQRDATMFAGGSSACAGGLEGGCFLFSWIATCSEQKRVDLVWDHCAQLHLEIPTLLLPSSLDQVALSRSRISRANRPQGGTPDSMV